MGEKIKMAALEEIFEDQVIHNHYRTPIPPQDN